MKSLVLKDLYNIGHNAKSMLIMLVFLGCFLVPSSGVEGYIVASGILCGTMVITTFTFDSMSKWSRYAMVMPITRKELVTSKFIVLFVFSAIGVAFGMIVGGVAGVLLHKVALSTESMVSILALSAVVFFYSCICGSISIPLVFKFGPDQARTMILVSFIVPSALVYGVYWILERLGAALTDNMIVLLLCCVPVVAIIWVAAMYKVSYGIFSKQEL